MKGKEPAVRAGSTQKKKHAQLKTKTVPGGQKFGQGTLKGATLLLGLVITGGIIVQVMHAPIQRALFWEGGRCYSYLKFTPSSQEIPLSDPLPALLIFNDLGYPAENSKALANYFAGCGFATFVFDYFAAPLTKDGNFSFVGYFRQFASTQNQTGQINASNMCFLGFGLGATCALTLAETLPPRALIAVNAISNFSRVIAQASSPAQDVQAAAQRAHWDVQLQNMGLATFFNALDQSRLGDFIPTLHVSRSQSNTTLLVRASGDPACTSQDQDELRERLHCEAWVMAGLGKKLMLDAQFHASLVQWLKDQGLATLAPAPPITAWVHATYVPAIGFLAGILAILLARYLKLKRDSPPKSTPRFIRPRLVEIYSCAVSTAGIVGLILTWGNLLALLWVNCFVVGMHLAYFLTRWRQGRFRLDTWKLEGRKTPRNDLLAAGGIHGLSLLLSVILCEPLLLPRGRNLAYVVLLSIEWGGVYLANVASAQDARMNRNGQARVISLSTCLSIYATLALLFAWAGVNNPLLTIQYPIVIAFFAGFTLFFFFLPYWSPKLEFVSLFLPLILTISLF